MRIPCFGYLWTHCVQDRRSAKPLGDPPPTPIPRPLERWDGLRRTSSEYAERHQLQMRHLLQTISAVKAPRIGSAHDEAQHHFARFPELAALGDVGGAQGFDFSQVGPELSYSQHLKQTKFFPELERAMVRLRCLSLIVDGTIPSMKEFVRYQPEPKLSIDAWIGLNLHWRTMVDKYPAVNESELLQAVQTSLVLGAIGKSPQLREAMKAFGIEERGNAAFYRKVMASQKARDTLPSYFILNDLQKRLVIRNAGLTHFGNLVEGVGNPAMYDLLKRSDYAGALIPRLDFTKLVHTCVLAAAPGRKNNPGTVAYNQHAHNAIEDTMTVCEAWDLEEGGTAQQVCDAYFARRAARLQIAQQWPQPEALMLAQLGAMMQLFTKEDGEALWTGLMELAPEARKQAQTCFSLKAEAPHRSLRTHQGLQMIFRNLRDNPALGDRIANAVTLGLPCVTKVLQTHQQMLSNRQMSKKVRLDLRPLVKIAAGPNPRELNKPYVQIDPETGQVTLSDVAPNNLQTVGSRS
jgi:hypothetical protein